MVLFSVKGLDFNKTLQKYYVSAYVFVLIFNCVQMNVYVRMSMHVCSADVGTYVCVCICILVSLSHLLI